MTGSSAASPYEGTRKALDLTAFRQKMAGSDKKRSADFDNYFVLPASARAY